MLRREGWSVNHCGATTSRRTDSQIEAKWQTHALAGVPHAETEGLAIPGARMWNRNERLTVKNPIASLSPQRRQLLTTPRPHAVEIPAPDQASTA